MKINPTKLARQKSIIENSWRKKRWHGTIKAVMGFGKTYCGKLAIDKVNQAYPDEDIIVVVPSEPIYNTWQEYISDFDLKNVKLYTIHKAIEELHSCHLLILDEIHRYLDNDKWSTIRARVGYQKILGLSGTLTKKEEEILKDFAPVCDEVDWHEALREKYISNFTLHNIPIELDSVYMMAYKKYSENLGRAMAYFGSGGNAFVKMSSIMKPEWRRENQAWLNQQAVGVGQLIGYAKKGLEATRERKKMLEEYALRYDAAKEIVEAAPNKKILTFSMTNAMTDRLTDMIEDSFSYHSDIKPVVVNGKTLSKTATKKYLLKTYCESDVGICNSTKSLDEGITVPKLEYGVSVFSNSTQRTLEQRLGRFIRYLEGRHAHLFFLYTKGTMEEKKWKKNAQSNLTDYVCEYRTLDEAVEQIQSICR